MQTRPGPAREAGRHACAGPGRTRLGRGDQGWTGARAAALIGRNFHLAYSVSVATRLMHRLGFTPQTPARRAAERNEQAVTAWREGTWPEVKGPGRPPAAGSASRTRPAGTGGRPPGALPRLRPGVPQGPAGPHPGGDSVRPPVGPHLPGGPDRAAALVPDPVVLPAAGARSSRSLSPDTGSRRRPPAGR
ncbi:winged helix-turn-helix domain-containing protein [Streptomyces sp. NPDC056956]|uniref:winged helix-turn-helix domain-containing protein n=1 Tax=unclassified Streptomyces TaxID=2593676 RepID=UPI003624DFFE